MNSEELWIWGDGRRLGTSYLGLRLSHCAVASGGALHSISSPFELNMDYITSKTSRCGGIAIKSTKGSSPGGIEVNINGR